MSSLTRRVLASTCWKMGTSISTPLVVLSLRRTHGDWAKPMTATSVTSAPSFPVPSSTGCPSQMVGVVLVGRVWFAGRTEMADVLRCRPPLVRWSPDGGHPHPHPHLGWLAAQDQMLERDVGAVDQHGRRHVRRLHLLPG